MGFPAPHASASGLEQRAGVALSDFRRKDGKHSSGLFPLLPWAARADWAALGTAAKAVPVFLACAALLNMFHAF